MSRIRTYSISAAVMLALDLLWLGLISPRLYQARIGPLLRPHPDLLAATLFYAVYLVGVNELVVRTIPPGERLRRAAARGALFGFVAYATFDLTAQAMLVGWSSLVTAVDMTWGTLLTATVVVVTCAARQRPLETVPHVDLARYAGTWYEIASFPQSFQKGCTGTVATYTLRADGTVEVLNRCSRETLDGRVTSARGTAKVVDKRSNSRLKVSFFWPLWGAYWIIDLGSDYEYAVVGHPNRRYLWVLSRTPTMAPAVYEGILARARAKEFDTGRLHTTLQATP